MLPVAALLLAGCASEEEGPGQVRVEVGAVDVTASATQGCDDGEKVRYQTEPPVVEVAPDNDITITVPGSVAERGWAVQVFDVKLDTVLMEAIPAPEGEDRFTVLESSADLPKAFYLLVVEDKGGACGEWSRAWPVGVIRAGGDLGDAPSSEAPPEG
ncbi:DUF2771 domain-containing protein [Blastococcus sp. TML/M2B]|nr:DUF2771 domain-containing protein [Blastococcus sp. TML/M2B]MBN1094967.1 DUF2771 domain-containing protein [Blastococcus sp. TML/C7B]